MTIKVAINGFGRIGRNILRALYECGLTEQVKVVAINELADAKGIAHLLKYDTSHGRFDFPVELTAQGLLVNGDAIALFCQADPAQNPQTVLGPHHRRPRVAARLAQADVPAWDDNDQLVENPQTEISLIWYGNRSGLEDRVFRIKTERSGASTPEPRTSHNISNVEILAERGDEVDVRYNFLTLNHRYKVDDQFFGTCFVTLRREGEGKLSDVPAAQVLAYFADTAPMTGEGALALVAAHTAMGDGEHAATAAAQAVPVMGALTGAALNAAFLTYYREIARIRFRLLRLSEVHGAETVLTAFAAAQDRPVLTVR